MKSRWWFNFSLLLSIILICLLMLVPTTFNFSEEGRYPFKAKINLGLDLQGGLYMIMGIDFNKVYRDEVKTYVKKVEYIFKDQNLKIEIGNLDLTDPEDPKQSIFLADPTQLDLVKSKTKEYYADVLRLTKEEGNELQFALAPAFRKRMEDQAVSKSIEVIRNRIDEFGVTEPEITSQGKDRIVIQLPGVKDIERAKSLIGQTAKLEFKIVNDEISPATLNGWLDKAKQAGIKYEGGKGAKFSEYLLKLNDFLKSDLPKGYELAFQKTINKQTNELQGELVPYVLESNAGITGDDLEDAGVQIDQQKNQPYVSMVLKAQGAKRFEDLTATNKGKRMAVLLDGNVYTAPVINERIAGGHAQITLGAGNFDKTLQEARDISLVLRAGALPVQLEFEEQRIVGPSLGNDSIAQAKLASVIACVILFIFIIFYYKASGVLACITLGINVLIIIACLVALEATLTLPGIAGIVLTVGMAVDGNIIIYERIREEMRAGATHLKALTVGFENAFWTIIDANLTTALAGFCLLNFGTGPVRGFAVTLLIGIAATIYTCYYVSRLLMEVYLNRMSEKELSI